MPLTDQARIAAERLHPHIVQLWRALTPLKSVVSFMSTGAHPDDETSLMLSAMGFRDGVDLSYACSTRGEGGQNDIGRETHAALGTLRTAEMERACDVLNLRMYWHSEGPDDTIFDFGFSKSGVETLGKWGRERTLKRFVDILRIERPDIICPTFLDIPGQHGHHRAMTEAAHIMMDLAADPTYTESEFEPWQVKKLYLPAWSGAGQAYDDDLPPPPATLTIKADDIEPISGWSYARIGEQSRAFHRTQAMGYWMPAGSEHDWPLHLADTRVEGPDTSLAAGLAATLADLNVPELRESLSSVQKSLDAAIAAFPNTDTILENATQALPLLNQAIDACPDAVKGDILHKLTRKRTQLSNLIAIAARVEVIGRTDIELLRSGDTTSLTIESRKGTADALDVSTVLPSGWRLENGEICINSDAQISDPYPPIYLPDTPKAPCLQATIKVRGIEVETRIALEVPPIVVPAYSATVGPAADIINIQSDRRSIDVTLDGVGPEGAKADLIAPSGWQVTPTDAGFSVVAPKDVAPDLYKLSLTLNNERADSVETISYPHIAPRALARAAEVAVRVIDTKLPDVRVGYIGGGNDRVDHWLSQMGVDVTALTDSDLQSEKSLAAFDTIVIGIFAMKFREGLSDQMPKLHKWCENGGNLVTLYHRPWDNWNPDVIPPKRLEIGQPSLRWRVTDETAKVTSLAPEHPILTTPNTIGEADWNNWHKERGLYFAKDWDAAYTPILSMADPEEEPLLGSMLAADIGKGQHIHTSLILHHQMEKLTTGAYNLMANLLAKRG